MYNQMNNKIQGLGTEQKKRVTLVTGGTTTYNMSLNDNILEVVTTNSGTINLPSVAAAVGRTYVIHSVSVATGQTATVQPKRQRSDAEALILSGTSAITNRTFTTATHSGYLVLYSTGSVWIVLGHSVGVAA